MPVSDDAAQEVRDAIRARAVEGDPLDAIERQLIAPAPLSEDEKSGLWLYAWSSIELNRGRRFVREDAHAPTVRG